MRRYFFSVPLAVLAAAVVSLGASASGVEDCVCASVWNIATVDSLDDVGSHCSAKMDSGGGLHVAYYDETSKHLKYAYRYPSGTWIIEVADNHDMVGRDCSLSLDLYNKPSISYYDELNHDLKFSTKESGSWWNYTIDSATDVGMETCLFFDGVTTFHISYYNYTGGSLKHAWKSLTGFTWNIETVIPNNVAQANTAMISTGTGTMVYAYRHGVNHTLHFFADYGTSTEGPYTWDGMGNNGIEARMILDQNSTVHVSYIRLDTYEVKHAWKSLSADYLWNETVAVGDADFGTGIAVYDPISVTPMGYISWYNSTSGDLMFASKPFAPGTKWISTTVDGESSDSGKHNSLALDGAGHAHMLYYNATFGNLMYANNIIAPVGEIPFAAGLAIASATFMVAVFALRKKLSA